MNAINNIVLYHIFSIGNNLHKWTFICNQKILIQFSCKLKATLQILDWHIIVFYKEDI